MSRVERHSGEAPRAGRLIHAEEIPSRADSKQPLIERLVDRFSAWGWVAADELNWLRLCLEEILVNAMVHGNEGDPALSVRVECFDDDLDWQLIVSDQGIGFEVAEVPDPSDRASLLFEHGRGILLMSGWLDNLCYYRQGAVAVLRRGKTGEAPAAERI